MPAAVGAHARLQEWQPLQATTTIGRVDWEGSRMASPRADDRPLPKAYLGTPSNVLTAKAASTAAAMAAAAVGAIRQVSSRSGSPVQPPSQQLTPPPPTPPLQATSTHQQSLPTSLQPTSSNRAAPPPVQPWQPQMSANQQAMPPPSLQPASSCQCPASAAPPQQPMPPPFQPMLNQAWQHPDGGPASFVVPTTHITQGARPMATYGAGPPVPQNPLGSATATVVQIGRLCSASPTPAGSVQTGAGLAVVDGPGCGQAATPGYAAAGGGGGPRREATSPGAAVQAVPTPASASCTPPLPSARRVLSPVRYASSFQAAPEQAQGPFVVNNNNNNNNNNNITTAAATVTANPVYYRSVTPPVVPGHAVAAQPVRLVSATVATPRTYISPPTVHRFSSTPGAVRPVQVVASTGTETACFGPVARVVTIGPSDPRFFNRTPILLSRQTIISPVDDSSPTELRGSSLLVPGAYQASEHLDQDDLASFGEDLHDSQEFSTVSKRSPVKDFVYHDQPLGGSFAPPELELLRQAEADLRYTPKAEVERHFRASLRDMGDDTPGRRNSGTLQNSVEMMDRRSSTPVRRGISTCMEL